MLINLHVKNLALIEDVDVSFEEGLNILTGETGAGKSIILGSINIALGEKIPKDIIRNGAEVGLVELIFNTDDEQVLAKLSELMIPVVDGEIIITRRIMLNGKSTIKINDETVSATTMRKIATRLINIHGQHDGEILLEKNKHLSILDDFGQDSLNDIMIEVKELYDEYKALLVSYEEFDMDEDERLRELSIYDYQLEEIENANLKVGEDEELESSFRLMSNAKTISCTMNKLHERIGNDGILGIIGEEARNISSVSEYDDRIKEMYDSLMDIEAMCQDLSREVGNYINRISFDEETAYEIEQRYDMVNKLKSKYGKTIEDVLTFYDDILQKRDNLINYSENKLKLEEKINSVKDKYFVKANELSKRRKELSVEFENELIKILKELNFMDVKFKVDFACNENMTAKGIDIVEFMISTNIGEDIKPLAKVASGGELSRVMLALKTLMAGKDDIDTMIFDEIDSGISGRTAQKISEQMKILAREHQIICITHLPQIAAMADVHFLIEKQVVNDKTITNIVRLDDDSCVNELARMLGGVSITQNVIENAKEMKQLAKKMGI